MNWGTKITVLYLGFVVMIVSMVMLCVRQDVELEYKDYYARELAYQDKIDASANEQALDKSLEHRFENNTLILSVPPEFLSSGIKGELHFYRPSDASKDLMIAMAFNEKGEQRIDKAKFSKGMYKLRVSWNMNNKAFFKELVLNM